MTVLDSFPRHHDSDSGRLPGARFARVNRLRSGAPSNWRSGPHQVPAPVCIQTTVGDVGSQVRLALQVSLSTPAGEAHLTSPTPQFGAYGGRGSSRCVSTASVPEADLQSGSAPRLDWLVYSEDDAIEPLAGARGVLPRTGAQSGENGRSADRERLRLRGGLATRGEGCHKGRQGMRVEAGLTAGLVTTQAA